MNNNNNLFFIAFYPKQVKQHTIPTCTYREQIDVYFLYMQFHIDETHNALRPWNAVFNVL